MFSCLQEKIGCSEEEIALLFSPQKPQFLSLPPFEFVSPLPLRNFSFSLSLFLREKQIRNGRGEAGGG